MIPIGFEPTVAVGVLLMAGYGVASTETGAFVVRRIERMIPTTFAYCALVVVGALFEAAGRGVTPWDFGVSTTIGVVAMALVVWGQWFINDVYDKETDRHSNPDRETTSGAITDREAIVVGTALVVAGIVCAAFLGTFALASLLGYILVNTAYSVPPLRTKSGGLSSMLTLGIMGGLSVLLGSGGITDSPSTVSIRLAVTVVLFMTLTMSYKDLKDAEHDRKSGVENFAVRYGADRVRRALVVLLPGAYLAEAVYFDLLVPIPLFAAMGLYVAYLLHTWTGENDIVYKLDAVNGAYLLALGLSYYLLT